MSRLFKSLWAKRKNPMRDGPGPSRYCRAAAACFACAVPSREQKRSNAIPIRDGSHHHNETKHHERASTGQLIESDHYGLLPWPFGLFSFFLLVFPFGEPEPTELSNKTTQPSDNPQRPCPQPIRRGQGRLTTQYKGNVKKDGDSSYGEQQKRYRNP